jgi:hypothetical protein
MSQAVVKIMNSIRVRREKIGRDTKHLVASRALKNKEGEEQK